MSVETIRLAIRERASELLPDLLVKAGVTVHKRNWRQCPCSWCEKKREATVVIGNHVPLARPYYISDEAWRDAWRDTQRNKFRAALRDLEAA